jgi:hypothetical protein
MRLFSTSLLALALAAAVASNALAAPKLPHAERKVVNRTVDGFVLHAVRHKNAAAAYGLVSPTFRAGLSRKGFAKQDPAYPFPARGRHFPWTVDYVESGEIGGSILLQPRGAAAKRMGAILFDIRLTKHHGRWLVDSLIPKAFFGTPDKPLVRSVRDYSPQSAGNGPTHDPSRISGKYTYVFLGLFAAFLGGLAAWGVIRWYRDRRIALDSVRARDARARATQ